MTLDLGPDYFEHELGEVDAEIARLASICGIRLLDHGVVRSTIIGDRSVGRHVDEHAFHTLRGLIALHYQLTNESIDSLGADASLQILERIRVRLERHFDLGGG